MTEEQNKPAPKRYPTVVINQAHDSETLEEREARYKLREEQRERERRERQRKGIE